MFAPFAMDSAYFPADQPFVLNLRVTDLDALLVRLDEAGVEVESHPEWDTEFGRFERLRDPEGLPLELWESAGRRCAQGRTAWHHARHGYDRSA